MDAILAQLLNGLDKGGAYALIALGLTLVFGTLGVVNFAHGALFMLGAFCAVTFRKLITIETVTTDPQKLSPWGAPLQIRTPVVQNWLGDFGAFLIDYSVPISIALAIPVMLVIGIGMERGLIKHFYKRSHAEQILVTFGLGMVFVEIVRFFFGSLSQTVPAPAIFSGITSLGFMFYPTYRLVLVGIIAVALLALFLVLYRTRIGMIVRAGIEDSVMVDSLGINVYRVFMIVFGMRLLKLDGGLYGLLKPYCYICIATGVCLVLPVLVMLGLLTSVAADAVLALIFFRAAKS